MSRPSFFNKHVCNCDWCDKDDPDNSTFAMVGKIIPSEGPEQKEKSRHPDYWDWMCEPNGIAKEIQAIGEVIASHWMRACFTEIQHDGLYLVWPEYARAKIDLSHTVRQYIESHQHGMDGYLDEEDKKPFIEFKELLLELVSEIDEVIQITEDENDNGMKMR